MNQAYFFKQVQQIIEENIKNPNLKGQFIANKLSISRMHLHRKLRTYYQKNASEFILDVRINKAKQLLINTNIPILIISQQIGFKDPSYFSKVFKKVVRVTPSSYRKARF